jgi:hypothetical protein
MTGQHNLSKKRRKEASPSTFRRRYDFRAKIWRYYFSSACQIGISQPGRHFFWEEGRLASQQEVTAARPFYRCGVKIGRRAEMGCVNNHQVGMAHANVTR